MYQALGNVIRDHVYPGSPYPGSGLFYIPDPGAKKALDPRSRIRNNV
jgi:hypothetical protein